VKSFEYKGHTIVVRTRQTQQKLWISTATFLGKGGKVSMSHRPPAVNGYTSRKKAENATIAFVKEFLDFLS
jgi:hypothetical protein